MRQPTFTGSLRGVRILLLVLLALTSACSSTGVLQDWPRELPAQRHFLQAYQQDRENHVLQTDREYLTWVVRFYQGWELMPLGWHDIVDSVLVDLDPGESAIVERQLQLLGQLISAEWAKDNRVRNIDSAMLSLWGGVMQAEFEPGQRIGAINMISADVSALLGGTLTAGQVSEDRYVQALGISLEP